MTDDVRAIAEALGLAPPGADLLDRVEQYLGRFVAYPSEAARVAAVLWAAHAHLIESCESTPRLLHASPEPGSGKTRGLEALGELVPRPMHAVNATPAALFRAITNDEGRPTILFDEIDTVFGPKAKENEEVRVCSTPAIDAAAWRIGAWGSGPTSRWSRSRRSAPSRSRDSATFRTPS